MTDIPAACFSKELVTAYPSAKIILTTRPKDGWLKSMIRTIHALHISRLDRFMLLFATHQTKSASHLLDLIISHYFRGAIPIFGREVFQTHNDMVKEISLALDRDFLEFEIGDGWRPLCEFLGKPLPDLDFPHVNDSDSFRAAFKLDLGSRIMILSGLIGCIAVLVACLWALSN